MKTYKHIFFDLDRTLWDFETNTLITLEEIFSYYGLQKKGIPSFDDFISTYRLHNTQLWGLYRLNKLSKEVLRVKRFADTLLEYNIADKLLAEKIADDYLDQSPRQTNLFEYTHEILTYLKPHYHLHIITNGFQEVQLVKVKACNIDQYFQHIITSEKASYKKPDIRIFNYALAFCTARPEDSLMIGDDSEIDIRGAQQAEIAQVWFNPEKQQSDITATYEIQHLKELEDLL